MESKNFSKGKYNFEISKVKMESGWDCSNLVVTNNETNESISVFRNYGYFPQDVCINHKFTGKDYMVCSERYNKQGIIILDELKYVDLGARNGDYCQTEFHISDCNKYLAVVSCYWAGPYFIEIFDFTNPEKYMEKLICWIDECFDNFLGFEEIDGKLKAKCGITYEYNKRLNKFWAETDEDEEEDFYTDSEDIIVYDYFDIENPHTFEYHFADTVCSNILRPLFEKGQFVYVE